MKELVYRKKIIIPYCGYISLLKLRGPIDKPYMETIDNMDQKIDRVLEMQSEILGLLQSNGDNKVKMTMPAPIQSAGLQWERLS